MPELPEVETIKRQLQAVLVGQKLNEIEILKEKSLSGDVNKVTGRKVLLVERRAKVLRFAMENEMSILVHLKMTGQLIYQRNEPKSDKNRKKQGLDLLSNRIVGGHPTIDWVGQLPSIHTRIILRLTKGALFFNDQRIFGWMKIISNSNLEKEYVNYGPDIINLDEVSEDFFYDRIHSSRAPIKVVILDQKKIAGAGNIYANDSLFDARIDPRRSALSLTREESNRLLTSLRKVMLKGIELGGASETNFLHINGMGGKYQEHFLVYKKSGQKCLRNGCGGVIIKLQLHGRGTYYCSQCQK